MWCTQWMLTGYLFTSWHMLIGYLFAAIRQCIVILHLDADHVIIIMLCYVVSSTCVYDRLGGMYYYVMCHPTHMVGWAKDYLWELRHTVIATGWAKSIISSDEFYYAVLSLVPIWSWGVLELHRIYAVLIQYLFICIYHDLDFDVWLYVWESAWESHCVCNMVIERDHRICVA